MRGEAFHKSVALRSSRSPAGIGCVVFVGGYLSCISPSDSSFARKIKINKNIIQTAPFVNSSFISSRPLNDHLGGNSGTMRATGTLTPERLVKRKKKKKISLIKTTALYVGFRLNLLPLSIFHCWLALPHTHTHTCGRGKYNLPACSAV